LYTSENHRGYGVASKIVKRWMKEYGDDNLMASNAVDNNPGMIKTLRNHGFEQKGKIWESGIHGDTFGLYLKFK
jgi:hypothetical protein